MDIIIEGAIGAGKTSLIEGLKKIYSDIIFASEPLNEWKKYVDDNGVETLDNFRHDKLGYSYRLQNIILTERIRTYEKFPTDGIVISERSIYANLNVFSRMLNKAGLMSNLDMNIFENQFEVIEKLGHCSAFRDPFRVNAMIFLDVPASVCFERTRERSKKTRPGEENNNLAYLEDLGNAYAEFLRIEKEKNKYPIIVLDGTKDMSEVLSEAKTFIDGIVKK